MFRATHKQEVTRQLYSEESGNINTPISQAYCEIR